tara:strand:+ start:1002 stop:1217 length:216 start_codon:yes stop_codon:yes gene_type:complete
MKKNITISWVLLTLLSIIFALIFIFPLYWALATSFKAETEVIDPNWTFFPKSITLASYIDVILRSQIKTWI